MHNGIYFSFLLAFDEQIIHLVPSQSLRHFYVLVLDVKA